MEQEKNVEKRKLSPDATVLLAIEGVALAIVVYGIIHNILF